MALAYQGRAMLRGLAKLGEPSLLGGVDCGNVMLERDVDVAVTSEPYVGFGSPKENVTFVRHTIANIGNGADPRVGQTLVHPDGTFVLDRLVDDNGFVRRFIVAAA